MKVAVAIEAGDKKAFATAVDWPGWSRSGKTEELAIEALVAYADRYAPIARAAGEAFNPDRIDVDVVEHTSGGGGDRLRRPEQRHRPGPPRRDRGRRKAPRGARRGRLEDLRSGRRQRRPRSCARVPAVAAATPRRSSTMSSARSSPTPRAWASSRRSSRRATGRRSRRCARPSSRPSAPDGRLADRRPQVDDPVRRPPDRVACARPRLGDRGPDRARGLTPAERTDRHRTDPGRSPILSRWVPVTKWTTAAADRGTVRRRPRRRAGPGRLRRDHDPLGLIHAAVDPAEPAGAAVGGADARCRRRRS